MFTMNTPPEYGLSPGLQMMQVVRSSQVPNLPETE
jgi:hypothetical protein